jgi:hypothetical protein
MTASKARDLLRKKRDKEKGVIRFCANTMSKPINGRLLALLVLLPVPVMDTFSAEQRMWGEGAHGSRAMHVELAEGIYNTTLARFLDNFLSPTFALQLGFVNERRTAHQLKDDAAVARSAWKMLTHVYGNLARLNVMHTLVPPLCFLGLLSKTAEIRDAMMKHLARLWVNLLKLEATACVEPAAREKVTEQLWPLQTWAREILVQLSEAEFACVPTHTQEDLELYAGQFFSTLLNERQNNDWRDCARHHKGKKLSPPSAWHRSCVSNVVEDGGRKIVQRTLASKNAATSGPFAKTFFESTSAQCSLEQEDLKKIHGTPTWPAISPDTFKSSGLATLNMNDAEGDYVVMKESWLSLLAPPGTVLYHVPTSTVAGFVMKATDNGLMLLRLRAVKQGLFTKCDFMDKTKDCVKYGCIRDPHEWKAMGTDIAIPGDPSIEAGASSSLCVRIYSGQMSLLEFGARSGLPLLNAEGLRKLFGKLEVPYVRGNKPKTAIALLEAIYFHILPTASHEDWVVVRDRRFNAPDEDEEVPCDLITVMAGDGCDIIEDDEPHDEWFEHFQAARRRVQAKKKTGTLKASVAASACPPRPALEPVTFPPGDITAVYAKRWLPPNTKISKSESRHPYWQVTSRFVPRFSKAYTSTGETQQSALAFLLNHAWFLHSRHTGEVCPYLFCDSVELGGDSS